MVTRSQGRRLPRRTGQRTYAAAAWPGHAFHCRRAPPPRHSYAVREDQRALRSRLDNQRRNQDQLAPNQQKRRNHHQDAQVLVEKVRYPDVDPFLQHACDRDSGDVRDDRDRGRTEDQHDFLPQGFAEDKAAPMHMAKNTVIIRKPLHACATSSGGGDESSISLDPAPRTIAGMPTVCST